MYQLQQYSAINTHNDLPNWSRFWSRNEPTGVDYILSENKLDQKGNVFEKTI